MIRQSWWKALGVLLLMYTFLAGLLVPLKTGIVEVGPTSLQTGQSATLEVMGYNTHYQVEDEVRAWLKLDEERALGAAQVEVLDERRLRLSFRIPEYLPVRRKVQDFTLIIDNTTDGAHLLPSAVFVTQDSIDPEMGVNSWVNTPISNLHEKEGMTYPFRNILSETIRNQYYHVPLWFAMILLFLGSVIYSIRYLRGMHPDMDRRASSLTQIGLMMGLLGIITGAIWAKNTWGAYWSWDVKQNMTAVALLIYFAYFILRGAFEDPEKKARVSAVYNIFAFAALIPLIYVIPRMTDSLHPGAGGNPAFSSDDLDNTMRMVFYPAVIGWTLLGYWIASLVYRYHRLHDKYLGL